MALDRTLLIDGDILIYKAAAASERLICWDESGELWSNSCDYREAVTRVEGELERLVKHLHAGAAMVALSSRECFRRELYPDYKAHRKKTPKPTIYPAVRRWVESCYDTVCWEGLEADDVMGVIAKNRAYPSPKVIVSEDKDMLAVPCLLHRPHRPAEKRVRRITYRSAQRQHFTQTLTGDATDGFPGLPGCGPKGAEKILVEGTWDEVVAAYEKKGLGEEEALLQGRLAKILNPRLYDVKTGKITLWDPRRAG